MHAVLVPVYLLLVTPITTSWWAAGSQLVMDPRSICNKNRRWKGKMGEICKKDELVKQISKGIERGQAECQHQFRYRRWNCTSVRKSIRKVMLRDTRETGFVNAILAAGIAYQVTKACTSGDLAGCSCKRNKTKLMGGDNWKWEGCRGDNISYGIKKSKQFLDTRHRNRSDMKTQVKLHNYVAGRLAIKKYMNKTCNCHGLSGSCTVRTCWVKMPPFREVGNRLKECFDGAVKVIAGNDGNSFIQENSLIKPPTKSDLVYSDTSPSFCMANSTLGSFGTSGRNCVEGALGVEGCDILCCNRGHTTRSIVEEKNCKCNFYWCCEVRCEKCNSNLTISTCL